MIQKNGAKKRNTFSFRFNFHLIISLVSKHWTERHRFRSNPLWSGLQCSSSSPSGGAKPHYTSFARPSHKPSSQTILSTRDCFVCFLLLMWFHLDWSGTRSLETLSIYVHILKIVNLKGFYYEGCGRGFSSWIFNIIMPNVALVTFLEFQSRVLINIHKPPDQRLPLANVALRNWRSWFVCL